MEKGAKKKLENSEDLYDLPLNMTSAYLCSQLEMAMALPSLPKKNLPESGECIYSIDFFQCADLNAYSSSRKVHSITSNIKIQAVDCEWIGLSNNQAEEDEMGGPCSTNGGEEEHV
jgi:hypothetical protein